MPTSLLPFDRHDSTEQFKTALSMFVDRVREDRNVLAVVLVGSIHEDLMWRKDAIGLWIIEVDGVTKRLKSDGTDERIYRTFVENGVNLHSEIIPRTRFRQMVEGSSRTAFSCNFFAKRELIYSADQSISKWFDDAITVATKDQEKERLVATTWVMGAARYARKRIERKEDLELGFEGILWGVHSIAALEVINQGEVFEHAAIYKAIEQKPDLFKTIYLDLLAKKRTRKLLLTALDTIDQYVEDCAEENLRPILQFLKKQGQPVPLSHLCEQFAFSQIYPWDIEVSCEWLERNGWIEKLEMPFQITQKSRVDVEEPAYFYDP